SITVSLAKALLRLRRDAWLCPRSADEKGGRLAVTPAAASRARTTLGLLTRRPVTVVCRDVYMTIGLIAAPVSHAATAAEQSGPPSPAAARQSFRLRAKS